MAFVGLIEMNRGQAGLKITARRTGLVTSTWLQHRETSVFKFFVSAIDVLAADLSLTNRCWPNQTLFEV
jgi:hypothetical protein